MATKLAKSLPVRVMRGVKKGKRAANKTRNEAIAGFASLTRQRNYARAHKRDGIKVSQ